MNTKINPPPFLEVSNLNVRFNVGRNRTLLAVNQVSFSIDKGNALGLVGESGSGKTTTAHAVARLLDTEYSGEVKLNGADFLTLNDEQLLQARRTVQFIFQDPFSSLNPRLRAKDIISEPLLNMGTDEVKKSPQMQQKIIDELFAAVGLRSEQKYLFPHQFSGGQRQRIGIARALATRPDLIICDEAVSALDVAVQSQILNLLKKLQQEYNLTYLFISHDLGVVQYMCDYVAVMYMGQIVEYADRNQLFSRPLHPYTVALLSAVPRVNANADKKKKRIMLVGERPDLTESQQGCAFASRCPLAEQRCHQQVPPLQTIHANRRVACHFVTEETQVSPLNSD